MPGQKMLGHFVLFDRFTFENIVKLMLGKQMKIKI